MSGVPKHERVHLATKDTADKYTKAHFFKNILKMVYETLSKLKIKNSTTKTYLQKRCQWSGPNYARGVLVVATSAVVGAVGASVSRIECMLGNADYKIININKTI